MLYSSIWINARINIKELLFILSLISFWFLRFHNSGIKPSIDLKGYVSSLRKNFQLLLIHTYFQSNLTRAFIFNAGRFLILSHTILNLIFNLWQAILSLSMPPHIFNGENYQIWAVKMKSYLEAYDLWKVVMDDKPIQPLSENSTTAEIKLHSEGNEKIQSQIVI